MAAGLHNVAWRLGLLFAAACGGSEPTRLPVDPPDDPPDPPTCAPERTLPGGACLETGVPAEACGEGFEADGQQGCTPILPADACPDGQLAVPGEAACHEVAPCPDAPYGDAPIEADTQFVDASYGGADSDGSMARPWTTIPDAIGAAADGAVVAIAAGTYEEGVWSQGKAVRLWGRCPAMVEIRGTLPGYAAVELSRGDSAEVHDLSITGVSFGVYAYKAKGVVLDRVHIHDTGLEGLTAIDDLGDVEITVRRSLVERASSFGIAGDGATLTIEDSVVRDTQDIGADPGWGIHAAAGSVLTVTRSVSAGHWMGISARQSQASLDRVVVRDTRIALGNAIDPQGTSTMDARRSVIERYQQYGVYNDSSLTLTDMVIRDAVQLPDETIPNAIAFNTGSTGGCQGCLLERGVVGVTARGANVSLAGVAIRDMARLGVVVVESSVVDVHGASVERATGVGIYVRDSSATVGDVVVRETGPFDDLYGDGISAARGNIDVSSARVDANVRCGVSNFGGVVRIGGVALECNPIDLDGELYQGSEFSFEQGDAENTCGCEGVSDACQVVSSSLAPPSIEGVTD